MNETEKLLFLTTGILITITSGLRWLVIFEVNQWLPPGQKLSYHWSWLNWKEIETRYKEFYPRGNLYRLTLQSAIVLIVFALITAGYFGWESIAGK